AVDREQNTTLLQLEQLSLELAIAVARIGVAEANSLQTVLAGDPATQRVVEVEHDALLHDAERAANVAEQIVGNRGIRRLPIRASRHVPHLGINQLRVSLPTREGVEVPQERSAHSAQLVGERLVESMDECALPIASLRIENAEVRLGAECHALHDDLRRKRRLHASSETRQLTCTIGHAPHPFAGWE